MKPTSQNDYLLKDYSNNIKITSRAVFTENGLEADFAGGGFACVVNCEGNVDLAFDWSGAPGLIGVIINDDFDNISLFKVTEDGEQTITIAEKLEKDNYKIEVVKQNPHYINQIIFKSLSLNGDLLKRPKEKEIKLQFIGDSISCGVGVLSTDRIGCGTDGFEDASFYSYNAYCTRKLNGEISTCALPGYGYIFGYSNGVGEDVYQYIDKAMVTKDIDYNNSEYNADVVVIEIGTNDYNYVLNHEIIVPDNEIDKAVQKYIDKIRSYNTNCKIVIMGTFSFDREDFNLDNKTGCHYIKLENAIKRAVSSDEKTYFFNPPRTTLNGRGYHPNKTDAKIIGESLADFIENLF